MAVAEAEVSALYTSGVLVGLGHFVQLFLRGLAWWDELQSPSLSILGHEHCRGACSSFEVVARYRSLLDHMPRLAYSLEALRKSRGSLPPRLAPDAPGTCCLRAQVLVCARHG